MPKKTTIPKTATDVQVTLHDENYISEDRSRDDVCRLCLADYQNSRVFEVSWHMPNQRIRLGIFVCSECAKKIATKYDKMALVDWFPEQPTRTREVVVAEIEAAQQEKYKELNNLYIEQSRATDKHYKILHDLFEELRKIDAASQPKIAPCKICGSTDVEVQKIPASTMLFKSDQYFYQCENGHTGTRAMFDDALQALEHWNDVMGGNNE